MSHRDTHPITVTIDGWSSCGKSTLARQLAAALGYVYIDSGAMYRAITLQFMRGQVDILDPEQVRHALDGITLEFRRRPDGPRAEMHLNGENVEDVIRGFEVARRVSEVAANADVRAFAVAAQRRMGAGGGIVMDGRDIGTVVFPGAELKIFMTAEPEVRVRRRYLEMADKNPDVAMEEVRDNLRKRDHLDSHREVSPLRQADDALVLDNSHLTPDEQLGIALHWARERESGKGA